MTSLWQSCRKELLGADPEMVVVRAARAEGEDTFTLGPNLLEQLARKRESMVAHWRDVASSEMIERRGRSGRRAQGAR